MSECIICSKECTGKTCSGSCRAKLARRTVKPPEIQAHAHESARFDEAHGQAHGCSHIHCVRAVNTRPVHDHHNADDIASHYNRTRERIVNRVALPGDIDYVGHALADGIKLVHC